MWMAEAAVTAMLAYWAHKDIKQMRVAVRPILLLTAAGLLACLLLPDITFMSGLLGVLGGGIICLISAASGGAVGLGDGLVLMCSGAWLGVRQQWELILLSFVMAGIYSVFLLLRRADRRTTFPFIPFVFAAQMLLMIVEMLQRLRVI